MYSNSAAQTDVGQILPEEAQDSRRKDTSRGSTGCCRSRPEAAQAAVEQTRPEAALGCRKTETLRL
jgi:hypothetical protein